MIIVTGGTGKIGRELVTQLKDSQHAFRVMARRPDAAKAQFGDIDAVYGDMDRPDTLAKALEGGTSLFLLCPHGPEMVQRQLAVIIAARQAGIKRIVKLSGTAASIREDSPAGTGREHWYIEEALKASGMEYVILRANMFMQNLLDISAPMVAKGKPVVMPFKRELTVCFVDTRDIAECALQGLTQDEHANQTYDVSGRTSSFGELSEVLSNALDRKVKYQPVPLRLALTVQRLKGASAWLVSHQGEMLSLFRQGASASNSDAIARITGHAPRSLQEFVQETLPRWQAAG